ncbi:non-specific serine,threonine protein kinase, partial [Sarracenia purpurea var. burkii]
ATAHAVLNEDGVDLLRWVQSVVREEWTVEVFDVGPLRYQSVVEEMVQLLQLAINCVTQYPDYRLSTPEVNSRIMEICRKQQDPLGEIIDELLVDSGAPLVED